MDSVNKHSRQQASTEEDAADHLGFETPRSGVATPQPDVHDRRLPGISYFGQVRSMFSSLSRTSSSSRIHDIASSPKHYISPAQEVDEPGKTGTTSSHMTSPQARSSLGDGSHMVLDGEKGAAYPTPPSSQTSVKGLKLGDTHGESADTGDAQHQASRPRKSISDIAQIRSRRTSAASPLCIVTTSSVHASHLSNPTGRSASLSGPPSGAHLLPGNSNVDFSRCASTELKKLTDAGTKKSGSSTPSRLSSAQSSQIEDTHKSPRKRNGDLVELNSGRQTPLSAQTTGSAHGQAPAQKGRLVIKIVRGRGLRKSRDPYVVAVFQRSELISPGRRKCMDEQNLAIPESAMGGVPISRQASDSGRPMAIPMRSRQSSNSSLTEYNTFRNRHQTGLTDPRWNAEAIFDVVGLDTLVVISVYDHGANGDEEYLGHIDFHVRLSTNDEPVRGWFSLKGHADTRVENAPTGEIFVEAIYQATEKRHYGPDDFSILSLIGRGTFGQVYQVQKKDTSRIYAMKVLSKKVIVQKKEVAHTVGERNILVRTAMSESAFIVGLKFSFQTQDDLFLVTDYMSGGELFWHLQREGRFDEKRAKFYIAELILAIEHLHKNDIVYRDLKPENILLDANGHIALCDFGLSKANLSKNDTTNTFCGTTEYLAPEVLLDEAGYTKMVDFWSLGVLVFEMCCGWSPFYAEDTQQMYKNIAFGKVRFPRDTLSQEGRNFVKGLLNRNPKHRLGAQEDAVELKRHAFFNDIDWEALGKKLITPPFKPKLMSETDVSYFDTEFTTALDTNGSLNQRAQQLATGFTDSTPLSPTTQANFQGFTFVDESSLDDYMHNRYFDQHMSDRREQDGNDVDGDEAGQTKRMSGIQRTGNDQEHFDS